LRLDAGNSTMDYSESLAWLSSAQQFGIKLGLENTMRLLEALGHPERECRFLHVAGTNGKGSTCAMMDAILRSAGYRSGLYTSPHLVDFRERIRVGGECIPEAAVARLLARMRDATSGWDHAPTYFELVTAFAIRHFADVGTDYIVLETGMGGRLDSTNVVTPMVSVITPIAMDHSQWLGDTIAQIAGEKAGILKAGVPVVSADQTPEAREVIVSRAREVGAPLEFVCEPMNMRVGLSGHYQKYNAALAVAALRAAGVPISEGAIADGLASVQWPGRFQKLGRFVLDGGHNPHAAARLVETWKEEFGPERALAIFGALADKDYSAMLGTLGDIADELWIVPVRSARAADPSALAAASPVPVRISESVSSAIAESTRQHRRVLITGSLFLVGEALEILQAE
jgi:dihydrofolate synthase/folylpolyglutamate synthase